MTRTLLFLSGPLAGGLTAAMVCLASSAIQAEPIKFGDFKLTITETLYIDWHSDNENTDPVDDRYLDVKNRLNIQLSCAWCQAGVRLDIAQFLFQDSGSDQEAFDARFKNDITPEKIYLKVFHNSGTLEVGDFYATIGKGLALSIQKIDELSVDTSVRGAKATYRGNGLSLVALGGFTNIVNVGQQVEEYVSDPNDLVVAAQASVAPVSWFQVSVHGSHINDTTNWDAVASQGNYLRDNLTVLGTSLSIPDLGGYGALLVEYDNLAATKVEFGKNPDNAAITYHTTSSSGHAVYASLTGNFWLLHGLVEFKYYDGFGDGSTPMVGKSVRTTIGQKEFIYYGVLPPLEDTNMLLLPDYYDQWGIKTRLDMEIPYTSSIVFVNYLHTDDLDDQDIPEADQTVRHLFFGVEQRVDDLALVATVYGGRRWDHFGFEWDRSVDHLDADLHMSLSGPVSLDVSGRIEHYDDVLYPDFTIARTSATLTVAPLISVSGNYEYSDQPVGGSGAGGFWNENFFSGECTVHFTSDSYVRVFGGSSRGGLKCSGGMCRIFPPFEGVKGELTIRF